MYSGFTFSHYDLPFPTRYIGCNAVSQVTVSDQRFWNVLSEFPSVTEDIHFNQPCKHPFEHHIPPKGRP